MYLNGFSVYKKPKNTYLNLKKILSNPLEQTNKGEGDKYEYLQEYRHWFEVSSLEMQTPSEYDNKVNLPPSHAGFYDDDLTLLPEEKQGA